MKKKWEKTGKITAHIGIFHHFVLVKQEEDFYIMSKFIVLSDGHGVISGENARIAADYIKSRGAEFHKYGILPGGDFEMECDVFPECIRDAIESAIVEAGGNDGYLEWKGYLIDFETWQFYEVHADSHSFDGGFIWSDISFRDACSALNITGVSPELRIVCCALEADPITAFEFAGESEEMDEEQLCTQLKGKHH